MNYPRQLLSIIEVVFKCWRCCRHKHPVRVKVDKSMINTFNKSVYFFEYYSIALRMKEECFSSRPIVEFLETMWADHVRWYKEVYPVKYRESLTLDQLARL